MEKITCPGQWFDGITRASDRMAYSICSNSPISAVALITAKVLSYIIIAFVRVGLSCMYELVAGLLQETVSMHS